MKHLRMFGLVAVAAAALMAFAGAGTASADELCTTAANAENMCPAGKLIESVEGSLTGSAKLENTAGEVLDTCTTGTWRITEINVAHNNKTGSETITGQTTNGDTSWGTESTKCIFPTVTLKAGTGHFTPSAGGGTTVTVTDEEITINTVLFGSCVYGVGAGVAVGTIAQGGNTLAIIKVVTHKISGLVCPETTVWSATYKITNHNAVFYITN